MPKKPINYNNTIFYKIVSKDLNIIDCYVGHTTSFTKRKNQHKSDCYNQSRKNYKSYVYQFIRNNGGWENWDMIEIEKRKCEDVNDARKIERYWIETLKATLNKEIPSRTKQEYDKQYHQKYLYYRRQQKRLHYEQNKDKIKAKKREKVTCECGSIYARSNRSQHFKTKKHKNFINNM